MRPRHRFVPAGHSITVLDDFGTDPGTYYGTAGTANGSSVVVIGAGWNTADEPRADRGLLQDEGGARIIDVASARIDRRSYGESGIDVVRSGTAKIIRIAPGYRIGSFDAKDGVALGKPEGATDFASLSPAERAVTVYPDPDAPSDDLVAAPPVSSAPIRAVPTPTPAPEDVRQAALARDALPVTPTRTETGFEPWTADWLRDCVSRYPSFDASLGTYLDEGGRRRFCTGER